MLMTEY